MNADARPDLKINPLPAEAPLAMHFTPGSSSRLVVSFAGVGTKRHQMPPVELPRVAHGNGTNNVLYVSDQSRSWMNGPGIVGQVLETIEDISDELGITSLVAVGNSMGGFAAMVLAAETEVEAVVAIGPQFSVHPDIMPDEWRWKFFRDKIADWRYPQAPDLRDRNTVVTLLNGGSADEQMHAQRFPTDAGYHHYIFPDQGHSLARSLHDKGQLEPIVTTSLEGRPAVARQAVHNAGGLIRAQFENRSEIPTTSHSSRRHNDDQI